VLLLRKYFVRQVPAERFLEEPPQRQPLQLQCRREPQRELDQAGIEEREACGKPGQRCRADYLWQVVVGQRVFPVETQHPVDERSSVYTRERDALLAGRIVDVDG